MIFIAAGRLVWAERLVVAATHINANAVRIEGRNGLLCMLAILQGSRIQLSKLLFQGTGEQFRAKIRWNLQQEPAGQRGAIETIYGLTYPAIKYW